MNSLEIGMGAMIIMAIGFILLIKYQENHKSNIHKKL